jgi:lipooligosaccharide transport system ATP-binding protein
VELIASTSRARCSNCASAVDEQDGAVGRLDGIGKRAEILADRVLLYTDDADATADEVDRPRDHARGVVRRRATLEDVFLRLTGRTLVD